MSRNKQSVPELRQQLIKVAQAHFGFVGLFALTIVLSDAWNLIPPEVVLERWTIASLLLVVTGALWYLTRLAVASIWHRIFVWTFILVDVAMATVLVFAQRGMASKSVMLFVLPILVASILRSRAAVMATAIVSTASYSLALVRYFVTSPGEGYKVELYTEILFYSGLFFLFAWVITIVTRRK